MRNRGVIGVLVAGSMLFSSTGAIAATAPMPMPAPVTQADPWAVLSVMSGGASAVAVCGASEAPAAARAASGCVLPQADVASPAAQSSPPQPIPVPPVEAAGGGIGISPLLIALVVVAAGVGLYFVLRHHHSNSPA